jgi:hypothetical protein
VIRVNKNQVASRRFGSSLILKDNLKFGIKEPQSEVNEKVPCQDDILNNETKRTFDRRCEFWLAFENGVRMHTQMLDQLACKSEIIPPNDRVTTGNKQDFNKTVVIDENKQHEDLASNSLAQSVVGNTKSNLRQSTDSKKNLSDLGEIKTD